MASSTVLSIVTGLVAGFGSPSVPVHLDECPRAVLTCERSASGEAEYLCTVTASQPSVEDVPRYSWKLSAGKLVGDPQAPGIIVDARGVETDVLVVTLKVRWPKSPPACEALEEKRLKLR